MSKQTKQESLHDYYEMAKLIAKVEKELKVERWVKISFSYKKDHKETFLWHYDIPVCLYERREWVIRWRRAKLQCLYPREYVEIGFFYYKKVQGINIGMQAELDRFISAKAQLTKQKNILNAYVDRKRKENDLFYNEEQDETLQKARAKLALKERNVIEAEERLKRKILEAKGMVCQTFPP